MFGIMFYSEGIDLDSLFSLLTSFDIPETLHLVAPGDHDFAPHWGRLGQYTEISNGFGCLVFFARWTQPGKRKLASAGTLWKRSPCSSCEFPSSVISHRNDPIFRRMPWGWHRCEGRNARVVTRHLDEKNRTKDVHRAASKRC